MVFHLFILLFHRDCRLLRLSMSTTSFFSHFNVSSFSFWSYLFSLFTLMVCSSESLCCLSIFCPVLFILCSWFNQPLFCTTVFFCWTSYCNAPPLITPCFNTLPSSVYIIFTISVEYIWYSIMCFIVWYTCVWFQTYVTIIRGINIIFSWLISDNVMALLQFPKIMSIPDRPKMIYRIDSSVIHHSIWYKLSCYYFAYHFDLGITHVP